VPTVKERAMNDREIAYAIVGQAILDEAKIGPEAIRISYYSEEEARHLWEIAKHWDLANNLRTEKAHGAKRWAFTIKAEARQRLYEVVGPLPNSAKDKAFRHLIARSSRGGSWKYPRGQAKKAIINMLMTPRTVREVCESTDLGCSSVRKHLRSLEREGLVRRVGKNIDSIRKNFRVAELWSASRT